MDHDLVKFSGIISAIIVGFFIGLRHSLDGDHVIAVSTMAKDVRSFLDGLAYSNSSSNKAMVNFQNALLNGLKNIPKFPNN